MNKKSLKSDINDILNRIEDEAILEAYLDILKNVLKVQQHQIIGYSASGETLSSKDLERKIDQAKEDIKAGKKTSHDDLKNEAKNW